MLRILDDLSTSDPAKKPLLNELKRWGVDSDSKPIDKGVMDIFGYAKHYIRELYATKSLRCQQCQYDSRCEGMHINLIRAHGYALLEPVAHEDEA